MVEDSRKLAGELNPLSSPYPPSNLVPATRHNRIGIRNPAFTIDHSILDIAGASIYSTTHPLLLDTNPSLSGIEQPIFCNSDRENAPIVLSPFATHWGLSATKTDARGHRDFDCAYYDSHIDFGQSFRKTHDLRSRF